MPDRIPPEFAQKLLRTIEDPNDYGVHLLFNDFWSHAPDDVIAKYAADCERDEALAAFIADEYYGEPVTVKRLAGCAAGTLGHALHGFITVNGLEEKLATNYKMFHEALAQNGLLDRMPAQLHYAVIRGFQLHDFLHVVTGYGPSPRDEIALQAFCLAQMRFPYFAMWISVVTARMTYIDPDSTVPTMDAVTEGWQFGRQAQNIQFERWDDHLDEQLDDLRARFGIDAVGGRAREPVE